VTVGEQFSVDVVIDYAEKLYGFQVWIGFDVAKLYAESISYMGYLNEPTQTWYEAVNNTGGYVALAQSSTNPAAGRTGGSPPPLVRVNFTSIGSGTSQLHLFNTILSDDQGRPISHQTTDGQVNCPATNVHDVAITNITNTKQGCLPVPSVCRGYTSTIFVTLENHGNLTEIVSLHAYSNSTTGEFLVGTENVTLNSDDSVVVTFVWNTGGFATGNYTIHALADPVPVETNIGDNILYDGTILVTIVGDITGPAGRPDGKVDMFDVGNIARRFMAKYPSPDYNPNFDINDDGIINMIDIAVVARHFGEHEL
jgi:hypothetical protein